MEYNEFGFKIKKSDTEIFHFKLKAILSNNYYD